MIRMVNARAVSSMGGASVETHYTLDGLPRGFSEGSVELVDMSSQFSGTKVFYARIHLLTQGQDLITMTTTSQGEWLTRDDCMLRVQRFLNQVDKWDMIDEWEKDNENNQPNN